MSFAEDATPPNPLQHRINSRGTALASATPLSAGRLGSRAERYLFHTRYPPDRGTSEALRTEGLTMQAPVRRKLSMAVRVRDFNRAHPSDDVTFNKVVAALEERLARADALAIQQRDGTLEQHGSVVRRQELRALMRTELLPQLVRTGERAVAQRPDLAGCAPFSPDLNPLLAAGQADSAEYAAYEGQGTLELRGQAFLTSPSGDVKLAAGRLVTLDPLFIASPL